VVLLLTALLVQDAAHFSNVAQARATPQREAESRDGIKAAALYGVNSFGIVKKH
jgi:hypothetical protein